MGAPTVAFVDHYGILGVDPKADNATIYRAYTALAAKLHPNNPDTGDKAKYEAVTTAYETLANPTARKAYDSVKFGAQEEEFRFDATKFCAELGEDHARKMALMSLLYAKRKQTPSRPAIPIRQIETTLYLEGEVLSFVSWYLKQKGYVTMDDKSSLVITVEGIDYLDKNPPSADLLRPLVKESAAKAPEPEAPKPATTAARPAMADVIQRALARGGTQIMPALRDTGPPGR